MTTEALVETVDCTFCDESITPEHEDGDTAFQCSCGEWHHYDCAHQCDLYMADIAADADEERAIERWKGMH